MAAAPEITILMSSKKATVSEKPKSLSDIEYKKIINDKDNELKKLKEELEQLKIEFYKISGIKAYLEEKDEASKYTFKKRKYYQP